MDDNNYNEEINKENIIDTSDASLESKKIGVYHVCIGYSIALFLLAFFGSMVQSYNLMWGLLITELILILTPPLLFLKIRKYDVFKILRFRKVSVGNLRYIFLAVIVALPLINIINSLFLLLLKSICGNIRLPNLPIPSGYMEFSVQIVLVAITAAFCEEVLFRGFIMRGFETFGRKTSVVITAVLFGFFHLNISNFIGPMLLGILIGYFVIRTNSIWSGIFIHFLNNAFAVTVRFLSYGIFAKQNSDLNTLINEQFSQMLKNIVPILISWAIFIGLLTVLLLYVLKAFNNYNKDLQENSNSGKFYFHKGLFCLIPGLILVGIIYFLQIVMFIGN